MKNRTQNKKYGIVFLFAFIILLSVMGCISNSYADNYSNEFFYETNNFLIEKLTAKKKLFANEQFCLALAYKSEKDYNKALHYFRKSAYTIEKEYNAQKGDTEYFKSPLLKSDYYNPALFEIVDILYRKYQYSSAINLVPYIDQKNPVIYIKANLIGANCARELKTYSKALDFLERADEASNKNGTYRNLISLRKAGIFEETDKHKFALSEYRNIIKTSPRSWQASSAALNVYRLFLGKKVVLNDDLQIKTSEILYRKGEITKSEKIINGLNNVNAKTIKIKIFVSRRKYKSAEKIIKSAKDKKIAALFNYEYANALWAKGLRSKAVKIYSTNNSYLSNKKAFSRVINYYHKSNPSKTFKLIEKYLSKYGPDYEFEQFVNNIALYYLKSEKYENAKKIVSLQIRLFPNGYFLDEAYFKEYKLLKSKETDKYLKKIFLADSSSSYLWILGEEYVSKIKTRTIKNKFEKAFREKNLNDILYFHFLLTLKEKDEKLRLKRLDRISDSGFNPYNILNEKIEDSDYGNVQKYSKVMDSYFRAGYDDAITDLYVYLLQNKEYEKNVYLMMSNFSGKYSYYYSGYVSSLRLYRSYGLKENISLMNKPLTARILPRAFANIVNKNALEFKVQNSLVWAVMKAESAFKPQARSSSNAKGLMQIMGPTASDAARHLKMKHYDLHMSSDSIRLGTFYLRWLYDYLGDDEIAVIGAYNAGAGNMKKWLRQNKKDDDLFIEKIAFEETRKYILKVRKFFIQYEMVY